MATSAPFSVSSYTTSTPQSRLLQQKPKSSSFCPTMSLLSSSSAQKSLHLLRRNNNNNNNGAMPLVSRKQRNMVGVVKASMENKNVEVFTKEHLAVSLAKYVADLSNQFIRDRGYFTLVLSGGSVKYLRKLVEPPYIDTIQWSKWHIFWVDEKVVPKTNVESNYKLAFDGFISKVAIPQLNVNTIDDALPAEGVADVYETTLRRLVLNKIIALSSSGFPKFDLMLLDMGPDGQVGALFPNHHVLRETNKWVAFMKDAPKPPPNRITLTLPVINSASNIAMVVTGAGKADAVYTAIQKDDITSPTIPVQLVNPQGQIKWYLDKGAASKLYK